MLETASDPQDPIINPRWTPGIAKNMITNWKKSGLSQAAFCRREAIALSTLNYWIRKTGRSKRKPRKQQKQNFVEVKKPQRPLPSHHSSIELVTPPGFKITLPSGFSGGDLQQVLSALKTSSC